MSHTPGRSWVCENNEDDDFESWAIVDESTDNRDVIAVVPKTGDEEYDKRVSWENARLIAAAPELLAALIDVSNAYQRMFDVMPVAWQTYDDIVSAAIAKATGQ